MKVAGNSSVKTEVVGQDDDKVFNSYIKNLLIIINLVQSKKVKFC